MPTSQVCAVQAPGWGDDRWERQPRRTVEPPSPKFLGRKPSGSYRPQQGTPSFLIGLLRGFPVYPGGAVVYFLKE